MQRINLREEENEESVYNLSYLDELLDMDEIVDFEAAFMRGYENSFEI